MRFFIDTANVEEIREIHQWGVLDGVTTNPSLIAKEGRDFKQTLKEILEIVDGPVSAEVISTEAPGMISEGESLAELSPNIVIKIPMTAEGLKAVRHFSQRGVKTNVTLIFNPNQALLAARAGATYVSPFLGRLDDIGHDGLELTRQIADIFAIHGIETEIIAASIRHPLHVTDAARHGAHIATVPYKVFRQMLQHPLTDQGLKQFLADWASMKK